MTTNLKFNQLLVRITKTYHIPFCVHTRNLSDGLLIGCGNPLLDITATVNENFLEKYKLKIDNAILAEKRHRPIYKELIEKYQPVQYNAGGSATNALRVFQWMIQRPNTSIFYGCVGQDNFARILENEARRNGVNTRFQITDKVPTGTCAALVTGTKRTFVANLAAANMFTADHLLKPENQQLLERAKFFYIEGYFLTVSPHSIMLVAEKALANNAVFMFNLSATFLTTAFVKPLMATLPYVDILFGNSDEYYSFAQEQRWDTTDLREIGQRIVCLPKENKARARIAIITKEMNPILVIQEGSIEEYPVQKVDTIADTVGAGDAFVGGFIAQYVRSKSIDICVRAGIYASAHVIQQVGCNFGGKPTFDE